MEVCSNREDSSVCLNRVDPNGFCSNSVDPGIFV